MPILPKFFLRIYQQNACSLLRSWMSLPTNSFWMSLWVTGLISWSQKHGKITKVAVTHLTECLFSYGRVASVKANAKRSTRIQALKTFLKIIWNQHLNNNEVLSVYNLLFLTSNSLVVKLHTLIFCLRIWIYNEHKVTQNALI